MSRGSWVRGVTFIFHRFKDKGEKPHLKSSWGIAEERMQRLKEEVRKKLTGAMDKPSQKLNLIDQIQRLGLAYHFEIEIDEQLEQIHKCYFECHCDNKDDDLYTTALLFRLLRQQGYNISCEIFNKFKDKEGNFSKSLITDVQGLLSLFEACHLGFHGDDTLNDALTFSITHLESMDKSKVSRNLEKQVSHALNQPIHKGLPRLEARHYIQLYQEEPSHDEVLLSLAKLDFNFLQEQHQKELGNITRWWKDLDGKRKFPFIRDRLVEIYFWMSGVYFEPEYDATREMLTKVIMIIQIFDDMYDVYATLKEAELFTEAIERWDVDAKEGLPEYMQVCYQTLLDLYDEIGYEVTRKGQPYRLFYAKEVMKNHVRAYFAEAKWFHENHIPTMEEYMLIASTSVGCELVLGTSLLGMGDIVTKNDFDWLLFSEPKMVKASKVVSRLMGDIAGHKYEQERGHSASSVECFMEQYRVTEEEAKEELRKQVVDAWKDMNEEVRRPTVVPKLLLVRILNFARVFHVVYIDEKDHYSLAGTKFKEHPDEGSPAKLRKSQVRVGRSLQITCDGQ
uniref:Terpene synthase n=1 Tax=Psidium guajava TaxID=120290 RepID=A0AA95ZAW7_PSIGU|nr:terpene synthase [Psidium guajava]